MAKWKLKAQVTVDAWTVVEADTLEDAIKQSEDRIVTVSPQSYQSECDEYWTVMDADYAEPSFIREGVK